MLNPSVQWWEYEDRYSCQEMIEGVYLGPSTILRDSNFLQDRKISNIVISRSEREKVFLKPREHPSLQITYHIIDIEDSPISSCMSSFSKFLDLMNQLGPGAENPVLIVGMTGMNRSASLVGVYVMQKFLLPANRAIEYMISRRRCVSISQNVLRQMEEFSIAKRAAVVPITRSLTESTNRKRPGELVQS